MSSGARAHQQIVPVTMKKSHKEPSVEPQRSKRDAGAEAMKLATLTPEITRRGVEPSSTRTSRHLDRIIEPERGIMVNGPQQHIPRERNQSPAASADLSWRSRTDKAGEVSVVVIDKHMIFFGAPLPGL
jgi:hypothetical protein